jgi:putative IMPACT (imprinted ancient) family translation regulator
VSINEQFPPEIQERRKRLWPIFKSAKNNPKIANKDIKWNIDKLIIEKKVYTAKDDTTEINLTEDVEDYDVVHTQPVTQNGSTFIGHAAYIDDQNDVSKVLTLLAADPMLANATHTFYAYRVGRTAKSQRDFCKDDGDHGLGTTIMRELKNADRSNILVVVNRWMKGPHLGPVRFDLVKDCVNRALQVIDNPNPK